MGLIVFAMVCCGPLSWPCSKLSRARAVGCVVVSCPALWRPSLYGICKRRQLTLSPAVASVGCLQQGFWCVRQDVQAAASLPAVCFIGGRSHTLLHVPSQITDLPTCVKCSARQHMQQSSIDLSLIKCMCVCHNRISPRCLLPHASSSSSSYPT